jgi:hypothetical protein
MLQRLNSPQMTARWQQQQHCSTLADVRKQHKQPQPRRAVKTAHKKSTV